MPKLPVVMLAEEAALPLFIRAFQAGVDGYYILPGTPESLHETLRNALAGWKCFSKEIQRLLVERLAGTSALLGGNRTLTRTEQNIMAYLILGLSDKEIAMFTSHATATVHTITHHIFKKLGVHRRREAVSVYLEFNQKMAPTAHP